jgi:hypothetical protein
MKMKMEMKKVKKNENDTDNMELYTAEGEERIQDNLTHCVLIHSPRSVKGRLFLDTERESFRFRFRFRFFENDHAHQFARLNAYLNRNPNAKVTMVQYYWKTRNTRTKRSCASVMWIVRFNDISCRISH